MTTKTTPKDFKFFQQECERWIKAWNLDGWAVDFHHEHLERKYGEIYFDIEGRKAAVSFATHVDASYSRDRMAETAKHEIIHLMLARLSEYGAKRFTTKAALLEAEEELVQKLLKLL